MVSRKRILILGLIAAILLTGLVIALVRVWDLPTLLKAGSTDAAAASASPAAAPDAQETGADAWGAASGDRVLS